MVGGCIYCVQGAVVYVYPAWSSSEFVELFLAPLNLCRFCAWSLKLTFRVCSLHSFPDKLQLDLSVVLGSLRHACSSLLSLWDSSGPSGWSGTRNPPMSTSRSLPPASMRRRRMARALVQGPAPSSRLRVPASPRSSRWRGY